MTTMARGGRVELLGGFSLKKALKKTGSAVKTVAKTATHVTLNTVAATVPGGSIAVKGAREVAKAVNPPKGSATLPQVPTPPEPSTVSSLKASLAGKEKWLIGGAALLTLVGFAASMRKRRAA